MDPKLPESCKDHQCKYKEGAWRTYSLMELGNWVHLLSRRAQHRTDLDKAKKDMLDARNYLNMMEARLDAFEEEINGSYGN